MTPFDLLMYVLAVVLGAGVGLLLVVVIVGVTLWLLW